MYSISDIVSALKEQVVWLTKRVSHEPLNGLVDGTNKLFHLPYVPAQSGTLTLYDADGSTIDTSGYTVLSYDTGEIQFASAPTDTVYATYVAQALTDNELETFAESGFAEMQKRYPRSLYLVSSGGEKYISTSSTSAVEPKYGGLYLSNNPVQLRLLHLCCRYALYQSLYERSAIEDYQFREAGRLVGAMIDTRMRPENIANMLEHLNVQIDEAVYAAAAQAGDADLFGKFIPGAKSDEYYENYEWWDWSKQGRGMID